MVAKVSSAKKSAPTSKKGVKAVKQIKKVARSVKKIVKLVKKIGKVTAKKPASKKTSGIMTHLSNVNNGFSYTRESKDLKTTEYLGYAGLFGAWTDDTRYFERRMMPNT